MRYSCAAFRILQKRYVSVLKKCALINAGLFFLAAPAMAEKIVDINEGTHIERFGTLRDNIINGTSDDGILILNLKADTNRRGDPLGEMSSKLTELTLNGEKHKLQGNETSVSEDIPITVKNGQTLNINDLTVNYFETFISNTGTEATGNKGGTVNISGSTFSENSSNWGGVIKNNGTLYIENSTFSGNSAETNGGAIDTWGSTTTIKNSTFTNNNGYSNRDSDTAYASSGGAINNNDGGTLNIIADGGNVAFTGNYIGDDEYWEWGMTESIDTRLSNAIANGGTVNLNAYGENRITFNDTIAAAPSKENYNKVININGVAAENGSWQAAENAGTVEINNLVTGNPTNSKDKQTVNLYGGTLKFGEYTGGEAWQNGVGGFDNDSIDFHIYGGTVDLRDGSVHGVDLGTVTMHSNFNIAIDAIADPNNQSSDGKDIGDMVHTGGYSAEGGTYQALISAINLGAGDKFDGYAISDDKDDFDAFKLADKVELNSTSEGFADKNHLLAWNKNTGILKVGAYTLQEAVAATAGDRTYILNTDESVTATLGDMTDGSLTIAGNSHKITASGDNTIAGITVGEGDALTINNVANMSGFATALNITDGKTTVNNSTLSGNNTGLSVSGGSATVTDSAISDNNTGLSVTGGSATVTGATISGNGIGGEVSTNGTLTIADSEIYGTETGNRTGLSNSGGTLIINDKIATPVDGETYATNITGYGTGLSVTGGTTKITGTQTVAADGSTAYGVNISNNNTGLSITGGTTTITGAAITGNDMGLSVSNGETKISASLISDNEVGGLSVTGGKVTLDKTDIANNKTMTTGGGISVNSGAELAYTNGIISGNEAMADGALYVSGGTVTLENSLITRNSSITATEDGTTPPTSSAAAIYNSNNGDKTGAVTLVKTDITANASSRTIVENAGNMTLVDSNVTDNTAPVSIQNSAGASLTVVAQNDDVVEIANKSSDNEAAAIENSGTLNFSAAADKSITVADSITASPNTSVVNINGNYNNAAMAGTVNLAAVSGGMVNVLNGIANLGDTNGNNLSNAVLNVSGGAANVKGNISVSSIKTTGGTATVTGTVDGSTVSANGGTTTLAGDVINSSLHQSDSGMLNLGASGQGISLADSTIASGTANLLASTITGGKDGGFTISSGATLATTKETTIAALFNGNGTISATGNELTFSTTDGTTSGAHGKSFTGTISAAAQTTDGTTKQATVNLNSSYGLNTAATVRLDNSILNYDTTQTTLSETTLSDASLFNIALNNGATANINGAGREDHNIALSDDFWTVDGDGNIINFADAHYNLSDGFNKQKGSDVHFINADISLGSSSADKNPQNLEFGNIALSNSELQLSNRVAGDSYTFDKLVSEQTTGEDGTPAYDSGLTLDVNLAFNPNDDTSQPVADKIVYTTGAGELNITELFITDDNGAIGQAGTDGKTIQILDGDGKLKLRPSDGMEILSWATNVYEYGVESAQTVHEADSINIAMDRPSSTDTLRDLNRYIGGAGNTGNIRGFSFIAERDDEGNITGAGSYNIYRDLDATSAGTFTILGNDVMGNDVNGSKSVLSSELKALTIAENSTRYEKKDNGTYTYYEAHEDKNGNKVVDTSGIDAGKVTIVESSTKPGEKDITFAVGAMGNDSGKDARGSMFEIVNETKFTIRDVSVEKALRQASDKITDGAAIYANNADAEVTLENTDFKNNEVWGGNGGAIANIKSAVFNIANALFSGNKASANGGAIYNDKDATMTITAKADEESGKSGLVQFTANATTGTDGKGGAIYNAGTLNLKADKGSQIIVAVATETASNDIYNAGTLNLNELKAESGENDEDAAGEIKLNSLVTNTANAELNINNGTVALSNVTNGGTLNINGGEVTLNGAITAALDNNNAATSGELNIKGGSLTLANSDVYITQKTMSIGKGVEFSANADQLKISEELNNAGTLTFTGGMNSNTISGIGALNITGNVENTGGGYYTKRYYDC